MIAWFVDRVLPGVLGGGILAVAAYLKLHFEKRWPYWGRQKGTPPGGAP